MFVSVSVPSPAFLGGCSTYSIFLYGWTEDDDDDDDNEEDQKDNHKDKKKTLRCPQRQTFCISETEIFILKLLDIGALVLVRYSLTQDQMPLKSKAEDSNYLYIS